MSQPWMPPLLMPLTRTDSTTVPPMPTDPPLEPLMPPLLPTAPPPLPTEPLLPPDPMPRPLSMELTTTTVLLTLVPRLPIRLPLPPMRLPTEPELPMRRINSSEDKIRTETSISMRTIRPTCPESRTSTTRERVPTPDSRRPLPERECVKCDNQKISVLIYII